MKYINILGKMFLYPLFIIYIVFEDLVWNKLVKPLVKLFTKLDLYTKYINSVKTCSDYGILFNFILLLTISELAGILSFWSFARLEIVVGVILYVLKLLFTTLAFILLKETKEQLFRFSWFKYCYKMVENIINYIKTRQIYINITTYSRELYTLFINKLKIFFKDLREYLKLIRRIR